MKERGSYKKTKQKLEKALEEFKKMKEKELKDKELKENKNKEK